MEGDFEERLGRRLARAVEAVCGRARLVLALAALVTAATGFVAATRLGVNADADALFDAELPFRRDRAELDRAIPAQHDAILALLDGPSPDAAADAAADLARRVEAEPELFHGAFAPGAGPFFERHGLLYLPLDELDDLVDRLAEAQPFLAALARDPSLRGVFDQLTLALRHRDRMAAGVGLEDALAGVGEAVEGAMRLEPRSRAFEELLLGRPVGDSRRFVLVTPRLDFGQLDAGRAALDRLREMGDELGLGERGVRLRLTGEMALQAEELSSVRDQATAAGVASFLLVTFILGFALRSLRRVLATVVTLGVGLVWTAGLAALTVGHLNMISSAFAVLFIGLGVDFGIHFTLRYAELRRGGAAVDAAAGGTAATVGTSLVLCAATTAIGFLAFIPTGYRGVAELGVIAGAGMAISLVASLTVLPALLALGRAPDAPPGPAAGGGGLPSFPSRRPVAVCVAAALVAAGSLLLVPRLRFDANPLHVRDPGSESVQAFEELLGDEEVNPLSIEVLAEDLAAADALAARLAGLPEVARAVTLSDWIPERQAEKMARIEDIALILPLDTLVPEPPPDREAVLASLARFHAEVRALATERGVLAEAARQLDPGLAGFLAALRGGGAREEALLAALDASLVEPVEERLARLARALEARPVTLETLPAPLRALMRASDGRARVQVFPTSALDAEHRVERFVEAVRAVAPRATGSAVYMLEAERTIVRALWEAFGLAALLIVLVLALLWRSPRDASLALAPLALASVATAACAVLVGLPINFADVIVLPLILGIGVDSGIHLVHRHRLGGHAELLETSTSRAVLWSALTTIASFGSLGLASHRGMASLGQLLTLGVAMTVLANLFFLPALLALVDRPRPPDR